MTSEEAMPNQNKFAELFADFFFAAVINAGGSRHTAHACLAEWWKAIDAAMTAEEGKPK